MILAGWAWDDRLLLEVARSSQADLAILMGALGAIALLWLLLTVVWRWLETRSMRRDVARAHRLNGRGRETA